MDVASSVGDTGSKNRFEPLARAFYSTLRSGQHLKDNRTHLFVSRSNKGCKALCKSYDVLICELLEERAPH